MKTSLTQLIEEIDNQQKRHIDLAKKDKKLSKGVDAILTATTLLKMKAKELLKAEKEQIQKAYNAGAMDACYDFDDIDAKEYYLLTFKADE